MKKVSAFCTDLPPSAAARCLDHKHVPGSDFRLSECWQRGLLSGKTNDFVHAQRAGLPAVDAIRRKWPAALRENRQDEWSKKLEAANHTVAASVSACAA